MRKGLINVMIANIFCMVIGILTNFLLPKYLTLDSYAMVKTYALYAGYAGFFSLGYNDGMYLKYGGKNISEIDKKDLANNYLNYIILELIILAMIFIFGVFGHNPILIAFSFGMFNANILGYLKSLYQATGEFSSYGKALNIEKFVIFIFNLVLLFILKLDNYLFYIWIQVIVTFFVSLFLTIKLERKEKFLKKGRILISEYKNNISDGFVLMLGNFTSGVFTGLDRWFIKLFLNTSSFAYYSFAVSMENVVNVFITPITVLMYNYFCKNPSIKKIKEVKMFTLIWGFIVIAAAFPAKFILQNYLPKYMMANNVIFILFAAQAFYVIIKGIYVNIYKAEKRQNQYLYQMIFMIIIGFILNFLFSIWFKKMELIAIATLLTSIIWLISCEISYKDLRFKINEIIAIIIMLIAYLYCGYKLNAVLGCITYFIIGLVVGLIFIRESFIGIIKILFDLILKMRRKAKSEKKEICHLTEN